MQAGISAWQQTGQERQSRPENEDQPSEAMLERWRRAYSVLATDAQASVLGCFCLPIYPKLCEQRAPAYHTSYLNSQQSVKPSIDEHRLAAGQKTVAGLNQRILLPPPIF
eukprot:1159951-Pelagomonas_calceolata.AAC.10